MDRPRNCKDCKQTDSWQRDREHDLKTEGNHTYELVYKCNCGAKTYFRPMSSKPVIPQSLY